MSDSVTVWERVREYAATQTGSFTSQEVLSWFRRHAPSQTNERTVRTHVRGACWNVGDRSQFASKEPFLTRVDRGVFRRATEDEVAGWRAGLPVPPPAASLAPFTGAGTPPNLFEPERHTEGSTQAQVVAHLVSTGWSILSVANTATREHGIDIVARRDDVTVGVEVKGYPSTRYSDPARAHEAKKTRPTNQAVHWYAQAVLTAMRLRSRHPGYRSVVALPDFPRYRDLYDETSGSLAAAVVEVWWVAVDGSLSTSSKSDG